MMKQISPLLQMGMMAFQYLKGRKLRTALTTLAIVFGVALMFALNLVLPSVVEAFENSMSMNNEQADLLVTGVTGEAFSPEQPLQAVREIDGIEAVTGILRRRVNLPNDLENPAFDDAPFYDLIGIDPSQNVWKYDLREGKFPYEAGTVIISADVDAQIGDSVSLMTASGLQPYTVVGILEKEYTIPQVIMNLQDAQTTFNQPGVVNILVATFTPGVDDAAVTRNVEKALGDTFQVNAEDDEVLPTVEIAYGILNMFGVIALFLGAFLIFNTFRTVIIERRHDLAMLRAIGATRRQMVQLIVIESLIQGIAGTVIGLVLGYLLASSLIDAMDSLREQFMNSQELELRLTPGAVIVPVGMGLLVTFLAGYFPARKAGQISPIAALRPATASEMRKAARWGLYVSAVIMVVAIALLVGSEQTSPMGAVIFLVAMVLAAPGLVVPVAGLFQPLLSLWFASEGDLARHNMIRQPGRAAITASTLMIGLATLVMIVAVIRGSMTMTVDMVDTNFASDILLMPSQIGSYSSVVGADEQFANRLRELPAVETVNTVRYASSSENGQQVEILGINGETHQQTSPLIFNEGDEDTAYVALSEGRNAIVNSLTATNFGLEMGDTFEMQTPDGVQNYTIVGIANDLLNLKFSTFYISQENLAADFGKTDDVMLMLNLKAGADPDSALAEVKTLAADYPQFSVELTQAYVDTMMETTRGAFMLYYGIGILILIPAALGLLNTLTINVLERTREIGIVRAIGGSRKQVRQMVTAEALLLGLFGAAAGVLAGVAMSYGFTLAFSTIGWRVPYEFPILGIGAAVILAVLLALFSSVLPARNAAKLDIIRALQYE